MTRYGLRGFLDRHAKPVQMSRDKVDDIHLKGGTVLVSVLLHMLSIEKTIKTYLRVDAAELRSLCAAQGTSRGNAKISDIVERLQLWGINHLYVIGGNGGNAAAHAIAQECEVQKVQCAVVGVPKSIDNDILLVSQKQPEFVLRTDDLVSLPATICFGLCMPVHDKILDLRRLTGRLGLTPRWRRRSVRSSAPRWRRRARRACQSSSSWGASRASSP